MGAPDGSRTWEDVGIEVPPGREHGQTKVFCPKCHDGRKHKHDRSLSIDLDNRRWRCHNPGCDFSGYLDGDETGGGKWKLPEDESTGVISRAALEMLKRRGISEEVARDAGVWTPKQKVGEGENRHTIDRDSDFLAFPYRMRPGGSVLHIKYRKVSKKGFYSTPETRKIFYGLETVDMSEPVLLIVEGELDVLSARMAGFLNVVSVPNGAGDKELECLSASKRMIEQAQRVFIGSDMDEPGTSLANELTRRIGPEKCYRVRWPQDCNDANATLMRYGVEGVVQAVQSAKPMPIDGIVYAREVAAALWEIRRAPGDTGTLTGYPNFDPYYRLKRGKLTITTGVPASGKSLFLASVLHNVAIRDGWRFALFTPEQSPSTQFYEDMIPLFTGVPFREESDEQFRSAMAYLDKHFILINPEDQRLETIMGMADKLIYRHGIEGIVIDPWTEVDEGDLARGNEVRQLRRDLTMIRRFAVQRDVYLNIVVHPNAQGGKNEDITAYDLNGGAQWFNKADQILSVKRMDKTDPYAPVRVSVLKAKFRKYGQEGHCYFQHDIKTRRYFPVEVDEESGEIVGRGAWR